MSPTPAPPGRLVALDVFRGATVALMILVNNPGSWAHVHPPLRHAAWHGLTPTDLVFPFFLFIVGAAMALSFARREAAGATRRDLLRKVGTRTAIIFACGVVLNWFPFGLWGRDGGTSLPAAVADSLRTLRIMGVLQRIALCYGAAGLIVVGLRSRRARIGAGLGLIAAYEAAMRLPLVAGWGGGSFALADCFARWCDLAVLGADHLWRGAPEPFDPEGLLSTLPAVVTVLLGHAAGTVLMSRRPLGARIGTLAAAGAAGTAAGLLLALGEPVNKQLWTVSYAVLTAGVAALALALCLWIIDVRGWRRAARPFVIFGVNPLLAFVGSGLLARLLVTARVGDGAGGAESLKSRLYAAIPVPVGAEAHASLLFALANVGIWLAVLWWLDRRGWRVKI